MLMICWFYCIPFAHMLYFAAAPLALVFAAFMLRRGVLRARGDLRRGAFVLMLAAIIKIWIFDLRRLYESMICAPAPAHDGFCGRAGAVAAGLVGLAGLAVSGWLAFHLYRRLLHDRPVRLKNPEECRMRLWANAALWLVVAMIVWTLAPWVSSLTVGDAPALFRALQWQHFAVAGLVLLLLGFWRAEGCEWSQRRQGTRYGRQHSTWSARDTLWTAAWLYLATLVLSYVAHDVLN